MAIARRPPAKPPSEGEQARNLLGNVAARQAGRYGVNQIKEALGFGSTNSTAGISPSALVRPDPGLSGPSLLPDSELASFGGGVDSVASPLAVPTGESSFFTLGTQGTPVMAPTATAGNLLATTGGALGAYNLLSNWGENSVPSAGLSGAAVAAAMGFNPLLGLALGALAGTAKAGKHDDQKKRDAVRGNLRKRGALGEDYSLALADGSRYNIGKDGGKRAEFGGRRPYEVDVNQVGVGDTIGLVNPLAEIVTGGDDKLRSDFAGYFTNAAMSSGDPKANARALYQQMGIDKASAEKSIEALVSNGRLSEEEAAAYKNGLSVLFSDNEGNGEEKKERKKRSGERKRKKEPREEGVGLGEVRSIVEAPQPKAKDLEAAYAAVLRGNQSK